MKHEIRSVTKESIGARSLQKVVAEKSIRPEDEGLGVQERCSARDDNLGLRTSISPSQSNSYVALALTAIAVFTIVVIGSAGCEGLFDFWESVAVTGLVFFFVGSRLFLVAAVNQRPCGVWIATALLALACAVIACIMEPKILS